MRPTSFRFSRIQFRRPFRICKLGSDHFKPLEMIAVTFLLVQQSKHLHTGHRCLQLSNISQHAATLFFLLSIVSRAGYRSLGCVCIDVLYASVALFSIYLYLSITTYFCLHHFCHYSRTSLIPFLSFRHFPLALCTFSQL